MTGDARTRFSQEPARGFTLIELLVVIAIIALLLGMLAPALSGARDTAQRTKCLAQLQQFGRAFFAYGNANDDYMSSGQADPRAGINLPTDVVDADLIGVDRVGWVADVVNGKLGTPGQMLCPTAAGRQTQSIGRQSNLSAEKYADMMRLGYNTNYAQVWYMAHTGPNPQSANVHKNYAFDSTGERMDIGPLRTDLMRRADGARVPILCDARSDFADIFSAYGQYIRETKSCTDGPLNYTAGTRWGDQDFSDIGVAHGRGGFTNRDKTSFTIGNILFGDGHVDSFRDVYTDNGDGNATRRPNGVLDSFDLEGKVFAKPLMPF